MESMELENLPDYKDLEQQADSSADSISVEEEAISSEESASEEREEREVQPQQSARREHLHDRIAELQREKYQALGELEYLRQQNSQLQASAQASMATAANQYNETLVQRIARVKEEKLKAREENDVEAEANADIALSLLAAEFNRSQSAMPSTMQGQGMPQQQSYTSPQQNYAVNYAPAVQQWANQNTWFHPGSADYDAELSNHIHNYCNQFDENLRRGGYEHAILSPDYLQIVSEEAKRVRELRRHNNSGDLNMQQARGNVSRVNTGYSGNAPQRTTVKLSPDQRDMARRLGLDEKTFLKYTLEDSKIQSQRGRR